jgi:hypothetical protein
MYEPPDFDLEALTAGSEYCTGAEIEQAVVSAMHEAFSLGRKMTTGDLLGALRRSPPLAVTMKERVDALRRWAKGRCAMVD